MYGVLGAAMLIKFEIPGLVKIYQKTLCASEGCICNTSVTDESFKLKLLRGSENKSKDGMCTQVFKRKYLQHIKDGSRYHVETL